MIKNLSLTSVEKLNLISNMGTMLSSGIPIMEVVNALLEDAKGNQKRILETLKEDLNQGKTIASSFQRFPQTFDPVITNLIKIAEEGGTLDTTLKDLAFSIKKDIEFSDKLRAALVYPILVVVVFFAVLLVILTFVIPRVALVFTRLKIHLPLPTKILIITSKIFLAYTPFIIGGFVLLAVFSYLFYRAKKNAFLNTLFSLPILSKLAREIDLTRFTRSMSLLLSAGIPITEGLKLSQDVVNKEEVRRVIAQSQNLVSQGKKLADGFKKSQKVIPSIMVRITEAGEKSGTLEKSMQDSSDYFELQVTNTTKILTTLFEPALLIIIGLLVGGVMLAIIAPIYGLIGQLGAR